MVSTINVAFFTLISLAWLLYANPVSACSHLLSSGVTCDDLTNYHVVGRCSVRVSRPNDDYAETKIQCNNCSEISTFHGHGPNPTFCVPYRCHGAFGSAVVDCLRVRLVRRIPVLGATISTPIEPM